MSAEEGVRRVLVVDPVRERGASLVGIAASFGCETSGELDADDAWPEFARFRPDVVLLGLEHGDDTAEVFLRRLQTEFLGAMPDVYFVGQPDRLTSNVLRPDGLLVPPVSPDGIARALRPDLEIGDTASRQVTRLRELFELNALSNDLLAALDRLVSRAALTFRVDNCLVWGPSDDPHWPRAARLLDAELAPAIMRRAREALAIEITVVAGVGGEPLSFLAAPLVNRSATGVGGICLLDRGGRIFSSDERDALRSFANRLAVELTFVSAHIRLLQTHDRLRESALLDPLLGVWTRTAFERAVVRQISTASGELFLAVLDFVKLRAINDRHGHLAGDAVLANLAREVRESLRPQDQIGRFGGDELAILLSDRDADGARAAIERLLARLEEAPFSRDGLTVPNNVTVGLTPILADESSGESAFTRALGALRRARRAHRKLVVVDADEVTDQFEESSLVFDFGAYSGIPAGSTIGGMYRILHEISRGAMGVVYRGEDMGLGRPVAIKVLRADLSQNRDLVSQFRDEAARLAALQHRNLVQVYSFGEEGDDVFFVMELVEGESLGEVIDRLGTRDKRMAVDEVIQIVTEIAAALGAMHAAGIIHRDVKPANVLLDRINDRAVLVDVGIARRPQEAGDVAGTPGFAAPETFTDAEESDATDVYGLASTAYAMLTGGPPYGGGEILTVVKRQMFEPMPRPSEARPDLGPAIDDVFSRALAPRAADRFSSATELAVALSRALVGDAGADRPLPRPTPQFEMPSVSISPTTSAPAEGGSRPARRAISPIALVHEEPAVEASAGDSRGVFFSIARKLIAHLGGDQVVRAVSAESSALASLLDTGLHPNDWYPVERLIELLGEVARHIPDEAGFSQRLGRSVISATLTHVFGADPALSGPLKVVRAMPSFWPRYHSWGGLALAAVSPQAASIRLVGPVPEDRHLAAMVGGMLRRIPRSAGGHRVTLERESDIYHIRWEG